MVAVNVARDSKDYSDELSKGMREACSGVAITQRCSDVSVSDFCTEP